MRIYLTGLFLFAPYIIRRSLQDWEDFKDKHGAELEYLPEQAQIVILWLSTIADLAMWPVTVISFLVQWFCPGLMDKIWGTKD